MHSKQISFICLTFLSFFFIQSSDEFSLSTISQHAKDWASDCSQNLSPYELQLTANLLYLLYINAFLDTEIHQSDIPLLQITSKYSTDHSPSLNILPE